jgi:putative ABC transport system substrate-binding protein
MRRRDFIILVSGAAAAWPIAARAQLSTLPAIGFLSGVSFNSYADRLAAFRQALEQAGFIRTNIESAAVRR